MKLIAAIAILTLLLGVGCANEQPATEAVTATQEDVQAIAEPTIENIESDLDTSDLDSMEEDLDSLIVE